MGVVRGASSQVILAGIATLIVAMLGGAVSVGAAEHAATLEQVLQLAQAADEPREEDFESCATICQRRLDQSIAQCSGHKNRGAEGRRVAPPAEGCRAEGYTVFESCLSRCHERWPGNRGRYRG